MFYMENFRGMNRLNNRNRRDTTKENSKSKSTRTKSKILLKLNDDKPPPLGYYKPRYDFVKPRVSATWFYKNSERKTIFDLKSKTSTKRNRLSAIRLFSATRYKTRKQARPQSSLLIQSKVGSRINSPINSAIRNISFSNFADPEVEYFNFKGTAPHSSKAKTRKSKKSKRCFSASKDSQVFSTRVGSWNTTYRNIHPDSSCSSVQKLS